MASRQKLSFFTVKSPWMRLVFVAPLAERHQFMSTRLPNYSSRVGVFGTADSFSWFDSGRRFYLAVGVFLCPFRTNIGVLLRLVSFKLNVDGALDLLDGLQGVGLIVRESHDILIGVVAMRAPSHLFVLAIEIYVFKVGLFFALDASLLPLVVESNSLAAVQLLSKEEECLAPKGVLVTEIRRLLPELSSYVCFIPRTANIVAHRIAHYSLRVEELFYWLGDGPS
ncbi:PREDICTED: expressed [Prunus dulcis]|uniref:PREDICTED: expressed n=1 Tax=Prunus dulcis TaxID=3755 RepID=A0A5E4G588_PRUDU|nr:PREDICTED: expressed [Prunus dulcis]